MHAMRLEKKSKKQELPTARHKLPLERNAKKKSFGVFQPDCPVYSSTGHLNPHDATEGWLQDASLPTVERGKATLLCKQMQLHWLQSYPSLFSQPCDHYHHHQSNMRDCHFTHTNVGIVLVNPNHHILPTMRVCGLFLASNVRVRGRNGRRL
jgi:hypothetical protein